jgi:hypothetical protein
MIEDETQVIKEGKERENQYRRYVKSYADWMNI